MKRIFLTLIILLTLMARSGAEPIYYPRQREDQLFLEGLRRRYLFSLAKRYCSDRLTRNDLSLAERAILTSELIVTLSEWSIKTDEPSERESHRREAISVSEEFSRQFPKTDWRLLVLLTDLKRRVTVARALRQEAELMSQGNKGLSDQPMLDEIREILRETIRAMKQLDADLQEVLRRPKTWSGKQEEPGFSEQQWLSLEKHLQFELAQAFAELARTYPAQGEDHTAGMIEANKRLEVLSQLPLDHPLGVSARLAFAEVRQDLGDFAAAIRILQELPEDKLTMNDRFLVRAALIRIALANQQSVALDQLLALGRSIEGQTTPELDYALLEAYLEKWKIARKNQPDDARLWETRIREIVNDLRQKGPVDWARRAELLVIRHLASSEVPQDIDMNVYAAENAYRSMQWDEAIAAFDRARKVAEQQGDTSRALQLGLAAAAIEHERGRHQEAWQRYHELSERFPGQTEATEAGQLAVFHAGQLAKNNPSEFLPIYQQELETYLRLWPQSPFSCEVALFLGRLHAKAGRWPEAVAHLLQSLELWLSYAADTMPESSASARDTKQQESSDRYSVEQTLAELRQSLIEKLEAMPNAPQMGAELGEISGRLTAWAEEVQRRFPARDWNLRAVAIASRMLLWHGSDPREADSILNRFLPKLLDNTTTIAPDLRMDLLSLKLECMAWLNQTAQVDEVTHLLREIPLSIRLGFLDGFTARLPQQPPTVRKQLASSLAAVFADLPEEWPAVALDARPRLGLAYAHLLIMAGMELEALEWLSQLAREFPEAGDLQEEFALLLSRQRETKYRQEALERFRTIARYSPEASPRWFRAKYMTAWLYLQLGDPARALEAIRVLETIHPDLGGNELRDRFLRLKDLCERQVVGSDQTQTGGTR